MAPAKPAPRGTLREDEIMSANAVSANVSDNQASANEAAIRKWYNSWKKEATDWAALGALLTEDFGFTSPVDPEPLSKATFKSNCWETQIPFIEGFDLEVVTVKGDEALVKYLCHTANGKSFRNVEYLRLRDQRIAAIQCFFGGDLTYASAVATKKD